MGREAAIRGELLGQFAEVRGEFRASTPHTHGAIVAAVSIWLTFSLPAVV